ncbi:mechanosensitive ion channel family protein [bacterium]|nr:mechanosensitive ion channel family protein [bacterium]
MNSIFSPKNVETIWAMLIAFLPKLLAAAAILLVFWILYKITARALRALITRSAMAEPLTNLLVDSIYRFVMILFAVIMAAGQLGINVGAALAGLGVAGIAVGLAAQDSLSNTIAGFMIFWDKPFEVGDWITVAGKYGRVHDITLRTTRSRTPKNTYVVIPNKSIIDEVLVNHSKYGETRIDLSVSIAYKEDIASARKALLAAMPKVTNVATQPEPDVVVAKLNDSSVDLSVRVWVHEAKDEEPVKVAVLEASKLALDAAGIEIPFPHLQLFVDEVREKALESLNSLK